MYDLKTLDGDFSTQLINSRQFRTDQRDYVSYYNNNIFYTPLPGEPRPKRNMGVNLLKAFADKNIHYTSSFPTIKKPANGTDLQTRQAASMVEKIISSVWKTNKGTTKQRKWANDATLMAEAYSLIEWDAKNRQPIIKRLDPRYCHVQFANDVEGSVSKFWYAVPMTKEAIKAKFGIDPQKTGSTVMALDGNEIPIDGVERFFVIMFWDKMTRAVWVGDQYLEKPHKHGWPMIPVDVAKPFETGLDDNRGGFFLSQLAPLNAEFNETLRRKANIIRKLSNPAVWGRGIVANQFDEIKKALDGSGGFVGLKAQGELAFLQLQETNVLDTHMKDLFDRMKDISGYGDGSFGQALGANTSGDAVSMYFAATSKAVENQWISWKAFYEAINEKILMAYELFGYTGEQFTLYGSRSVGTIEPVENEDGTVGNKYQTGGYEVKFSKDMLKGIDKCTEIITPTATPKDETAAKNYALQASNGGFLPRVRAYEIAGELDPEQTLDLLAEERQDPRLHPEVLQQVSQAMAMGQGGGMSGAAPLPATSGATAPQPMPIGG